MGYRSHRDSFPSKSAASPAVTQTAIPETPASAPPTFTQTPASATPALPQASQVSALGMHGSGPLERRGSSMDAAQPPSG